MNCQQAELYQQIHEFSLDEPDAQLTFSKRLARDNGWTIEYTQRVIDEYKKFVFLAIVAGHPVTPSDQVDQAWHLHLTYTQSYWGEFCPNVLRTPLHHNPTLGGHNEQNKFNNWYNKTLASYQQFFGEPPTDIWSPPHIRFGRDIDFVRVNKQQNWILPKPNLNNFRFPQIQWQQLNHGSILALCFGLSFIITGCEFLVVGGKWNPLNFNGTEFLLFYILVAGASILLALLLRRLVLSSVGRPSPESTQLNPYEIAYLTAGSNRAIDVAIANLLHSGQLEILKSKEGFRRTSNQVYGGHPLEQAVLETVNTSYTGYTFKLIRQLASPATKPIETRLQQLGLILTSGQAQLVRWLPSLLVFAVLLLGITKIFVGIWRDRPVGYLTILCIITAFVGLRFWQIPTRSLYGDRTLATLQTQYAGLRSKSSHLPVSMSELALAFALFGSTALVGSPLIILHKLLTPKISSIHSATASGSGGDGGGGCGGGGCGGGGCGGCGG